MRHLQFGFAFCLAAMALSAASCQKNVAGTQREQLTAQSSPQDLDQAYRDYSNAIDRNPNDAEAYYNRGFVQSLRNQNDAATADYSRAIELRPTFAAAYLNRGTAYYQQGRYDLALADDNRAVQLSPDYGVAYENRAWVYYSLGDYARARADADMARQKGRAPSPYLMDLLNKAQGQ